MLFTVVLRLITTVLYTFVTRVRFTRVLVKFTLFTYPRLTRYPGINTSPGASGNHPTPAPNENEKLNPGPPPTHATSAGAYTGRTTLGPGTHSHPVPANAHRP